ncbi:hypothetical protein Sjap_006049 [Stephania japonica]|uniref:Auxin efflux carrier component n=1 Tax=Stephania japonica TaxID=461633 RepID=A0AAP0K530_9MAGN
MITFKDLYSVLSAVVPLYVTMFLAYMSVKWWKIFTPEQCAGINRFVAIFAVPLLSFEVISRINPYKMDHLFIAADIVSKLLLLLLLFMWAKFTKRGSLDWAVTLFSLASLPNTLVMGIPLLKSMYGDDKEALMVQVVVLQCIIWYTLMLFLLEYRAARIQVYNEKNPISADIEGGGSEEATLQGNKVDNKGATDGSAEEDVAVHVIVTRPSNSKPSDSDPQALQNINKVAPDSKRFNPLATTTTATNATEEDGKELHLFVWRCGCCSAVGVNEEAVQASNKEGGNSTPKAKSKESDKAEFSMNGEMLRSILKMVWFRLVRNPNSYASLLGLGWALSSCRWGFKKPQIMENSVTILSNAGLGMAMFSLGLFMALQPRIIACGKRLAMYGMLVRFVAGPAIMSLASIVVGLRGSTLKVAIVQAALPQGIVPFVFAREYNLHPDVLSTA